MTLSCLGLVPRLRWLFVGILRVVEPLPHRQRFSARNYMTTLASASLSWENQEHRTHMVGQFTIVILGCVWLHWHCDAPCSLRPSLGYSHTWLQCTVVSQYGTSLSSHFCTLVSALPHFPLAQVFNLWWVLDLFWESLWWCIDPLASVYNKTSCQDQFMILLLKGCCSWVRWYCDYM